MVPALGDLPGQVHLATEAVPVDAGRAELLEDLERPPLALAGVDDDRLPGVERDAHERAKGRLLRIPQGLRHPVPVEPDLADGEGVADLLAEPADAVVGRDRLVVAGIVDALAAISARTVYEGEAERGLHHRMAGGEAEAWPRCPGVETVRHDGRGPAAAHV
jgi:hypothetical protein